MIFMQGEDMLNMPQAKLEEEFDRVPQYLFRVHTLKSKGTELKVESPAVSRGLNDINIFEMDKDMATTMIEEHLSWRNSWSDNFISWTCSLLFALQYAIYRYNADFGDHNYEDIHICVVDTTRVTRGSFLSARSLMLAYGIKEVGRLEFSPNDLRDEYLSQGTVNIEEMSITTNLGVLLDSGLYSIIPELDIESEKRFLWRRVKELRAEFSRFPKYATADETDRVRLLIAKSFGGIWEVPMTVIFLSLRSRDEHVDLICKEIERGFSESALHQAARWASDKISMLANIEIPEFQQYLKVMAKAYQNHRRLEEQSSTGVLADIMGNLSIAKYRVRTL